jgi:hypothetical protein
LNERISAVAHDSRFAAPGALLLVVVATLVVVWPLPLDLGHTITGHVDALFGAWRIAWIGDALIGQPSALFHAPIFSPHRWTLAYSDSVLLPGTLAAPFRWAVLGGQLAGRRPASVAGN